MTQIAVLTVPLTEWNEQKAILYEMAEQIKALTHREQKELLTPKEVCQILKIGRATFERYKNDGKIEVLKIDRTKYSKIYVKRSHLEDLIKQGVI